VIKKANLQTRLLLSYLLVFIVGIGSYIIATKISSPRFFTLYLEQLEGIGYKLRYVRAPLVRGFVVGSDQGTIWSLIVSGAAAGGLSYWISQRIVKPLLRMERITQQFAAGHFDEQMPMNLTPELNQLAMSFNRMAASLKEVEKRRRELISDVTHELRTPLTIVRGYLEQLADGTIEPSPEIYQRLTRVTTRLERLVNDLQELSKAEAGSLSIKLRPTNLRPLLEVLVKRLSEQLLEGGPVLRLESPFVLPLVLADPDRVEQILVNLLGNAIRYTDQGAIMLRVWSEPQQLWIAVVDTGQGIAPEDLPYIFERFWRAEQSRFQHPGGTGIGLAITRRLVELQGGQIKVESKLNRGSTFQFSLPLA